MGDRGQVKIVDHGEDTVYLYTHYGAYCLVQLVQEALNREIRWSDGCYLARIIFETMIPDGEKGTELGYGICAGRHGDTRIEVQVDVEHKKITVVSPGWNEADTEIWDGTFEEFIAHDFGDEL